MFGQQNTTPFGSAPAGNTPFGSTANSTPAFGSPAPAPFGGFGGGGGGGGGFGTPAPAPAFGGFGAPAPAPAFGGFGAAPAPTGFGATANSSPFGAPAPAPSGGLFGAPAPAPSGGLFGSTNNNAFGASNTNNAFGGGGGFGASSNNNSAFGAPAPAFGAPAPAFGAPAPAAGGIFGAPAAPAPAFGGFGAPAPAAPAGGMFGAPAPAAGGGMFGAPSGGQGGGTKLAPYQVSTRQDGTSSISLQSITAMSQYEQKSFEELRFEDYSQGNKGDGSGNQAAGGGFGGFGGTPAPAPGGFGMFGGTPAPAPFGAAAPAPFGSPAPAPFGAPAPAPAFGGFGAAAPAPAFGAPAPSTGFGGFGAKPPAAGGLFGSPAPAPAGGLFGAPAPAPAGGLFGSTPAPAPFGAPAPAGGLFGAPAPAPAAGGLFGSPAPAPSGGLFGAPAPAPGGLFGAPAPAPGGLFGAPAPAPAFGAPAPGGLFGAPAPAPGGLFGAKPAGGLFGSPAPAPGGFFGAAPPAPSMYGAQPQAPMAPGFASPMGMPANIIPPATDAVLQQQLAAVDNQRKELEKLDVWRGKSPQTATTVPTSLSESEAGLRVSPYTSSSTISTYRASPRSTTKIRPRGFGSPAPPSSATKLASSIGGGGTPMLSPTAISASSAKKLTIRPGAHTPKVKLRLQLTDKTIEEKKSEEPALRLRADSPHITTPPATKSPVVARMPESTPQPQPVQSPRQVNPPAATGQDLYKMIVGTPSKKPAPPSGFVPKLTKKYYETTPSLAQLSKKSEADLAAVSGFSISRDGIGSVSWEGAVDIRGVDLDAVVSIELKDVSVYEEQEKSGTKPAEGSKLNRPAVISLHQTYPKKGGASASMEAKQKFSLKLEKTCGQMGAEFISYDQQNGIWKFRVSHFSRYGLFDDDSDDDEDMAEPNPKASVSDQENAAPLVNFKSGERGGRSPMKSPTRYTFVESDDEVDVAMEDTGDLALLSDAETNQKMAHECYQQLFLSPQVQTRTNDVEVEDDSEEFFEEEILDEHQPIAREVCIPNEIDFVFRGGVGITSKIAQRCGVAKSNTDFGLRMGKSFRVGWRPDGSFLHLNSGAFLVQSRPVFRDADVSSPMVLDAHRKQADKDGSGEVPFYSTAKTSLAKTTKTFADATSTFNGESETTISQAFRLMSCLVAEKRSTSSAIIPVQDGAMVQDGAIIGTDRSVHRPQAMEEFQRWLMDSCSQNVRREIKAACRSNNAPRAIFAAITAGDFPQAANLATDFACKPSSDSMKSEYAYLQLATMLTAGESCSAYIRDEVHTWHEQGLVRKCPPLLLRVYTLLGADLNLEEQLHAKGDHSVDWMRRLGLLLRYGEKEDGSKFDFASLIQQYDADVAANIAPHPSPLYSNPSKDAKSLLYHIIRLCDTIVNGQKDETIALSDIVAPSGYSSNPHDYSGAFLMASTMAAMNCCSALSDSDQMKLLNGYATQLIAEGYWEYAVYVTLCEVGTSSLRNWRIQQAKQIVLQNCNSDVSRKLLVDKIGVPEVWFAEASADRAANSGDTFEYVRHLAKVSGEETRQVLENEIVPIIFFRNAQETAKSIKMLRPFANSGNSLADTVLDYFGILEDIMEIPDEEADTKKENVADLRERASVVEEKLKLCQSQQENLVSPSLRTSHVLVPMQSFLSEALNGIAFMKLQLMALEAGGSIWDDEMGGTRSAVPMKIASQLLATVAVAGGQQPEGENVPLSGFM